MCLLFVSSHHRFHFMFPESVQEQRHLRLPPRGGIHMRVSTIILERPVVSYRRHIPRVCVCWAKMSLLWFTRNSRLCVCVCVIFLLFFCEDCPIFVSFVWNCYDCCKKMWIYFDCRLSSVYLIHPPPPQVSRNFGPQLYTLSLPSPSIFPGWCRWLGWRVDGWGRGMGGVSVCVYPRVKHLRPPPLPTTPQALHCLFSLPCYCKHGFFFPTEGNNERLLGNQCVVYIVEKLHLPLPSK